MLMRKYIYFHVYLDSDEIYFELLVFLSFFFSRKHRIKKDKYVHNVCVFRNLKFCLKVVKC